MLLARATYETRVDCLPFGLERLLFVLEKKTGEPNANRVSGVLIGSANARRTRVPCYWVWEHDHLTSCFDYEFDLSGKHDYVHSYNKVAFQLTL